MASKWFLKFTNDLLNNVAPSCLILNVDTDLKLSSLG